MICNYANKTSINLSFSGGGGGPKMLWVNKYTQTVMVAYSFIHPLNIYTWSESIHIYQLFNSAVFNHQLIEKIHPLDLPH